MSDLDLTAFHPDVIVSWGQTGPREEALHLAAYLFSVPSWNVEIEVDLLAHVMHGSFSREGHLLASKTLKKLQAGGYSRKGVMSSSGLVLTAKRDRKKKQLVAPMAKKSPMSGVIRDRKHEPQGKHEEKNIAKRQFPGHVSIVS